MFKASILTVVCAFTAASALADEIVNDDFTFTPGATGVDRLDREVWTNGGGYQVIGDAVTGEGALNISSFGSNFGHLWNDPTTVPNAAPLNSQVGYASMDISQLNVAGELQPLAGNFLIPAVNLTNTNNAILDVRFGPSDGIANPQATDLGVGNYEFLWNNSLSVMDFTLPLSGFSGTIGSGETLIVKDGDTVGALSGVTDNNATVNVGDDAVSYRFWVNRTVEPVGDDVGRMVVDNFVLWDTIPNESSGLSADFNTDGTVDLLDLDILGGNWQMAGTSATGDANGDGVVDLLDLDLLGAQWQQSGSFASALAASGIAVPEPASAALIALGSTLMIRRRTARA